MANTKRVLKKRKHDLSVIQFQQLFNNEKSCRDYLFKLKWPQGFICPKCGNTRYYLVKKRLLCQCAECKTQTSVTAGTILHRTHLTLQKWFWAIYLISRDKRGCSALLLKNMINVSYPTAWLMFQKIRTAMALKEKDYILTGIVVLDDAYFGGATQGQKRGRGTEKSKVLVAVSLNKLNHPLFAKMEVIENLKAETISNAVTKMVESGSILRSDSYKSLINLDSYEHEVIVSKENKDLSEVVFKWANVLIGNAKSYILGTYHGLPAKHLDRYLKEFCYRFNRRYLEHIIFGKLINACIFAGPATYAELTL